MQTSRLAMFCTPAELMTWLAALAFQNELTALVFRGGSRVGVVETTEALIGDPDASWVLMLPVTETPAQPVDSGDVHSIQNGWLDVRPGRLVRVDETDIMLLTEVTARDLPDVTNRPVRWLQRLKRLVKKDGVVNGVTGRNVVHGGESLYHDIRFSPEAAILHRSGVVWKQFVDGNAVFEPGPSGVAVSEQASTRLTSPRDGKARGLRLRAHR